MGLLKGVYMVSYSFFKYLYCFVIFIALPSTSEALFCQENWLNGVILTAAIPGGAQIECNTLNYFYYNNPYDSVFYMMTNGASIHRILFHSTLARQNQVLTADMEDQLTPSEMQCVVRFGKSLQSKHVCNLYTIPCFM